MSGGTIIQARIATVSRYFRGLARINFQAISWWMAVRNTLGLLIAFLVLWATGHTSLISIAGVGTMNISFSDRPGTDFAKIPRMLITTLLAAGTVMIGAMLGVHTWFAMIVATVLALPFGMFAMLGDGALQAGTTAIIAYVVATMQRADLAKALEFGGIIVVCGVLQTLLAVSIGHRRVEDPPTHYLAISLAELGRSLRQRSFMEGEPPGAIALSRAWTAFSSRRHDATTASMSQLLSSVQAMQSHAIALMRETDELGETSDDRERRRACATAMSSMAEAVGAGCAVPQHAIPEGRHCTPALGESVQALLTAMSDVARDWDLTLRAKSATRRRMIDQDWRWHARGLWRTLRANMTTASPVLRHALRLSVAVAIGWTTAAWSGVGHVAWAPLTVAFALRPDFYSTSSRAVARIIGTEIGLILGTGVLFFLPPTMGTHIALLIAMAFATKVLTRTNPVIGAVTITAYVVLLLSVMGQSPRQAFIDRTVETFIGGSVAVVVFLVWPTWDRHRAADALAGMLREYARGRDLLMAAHWNPERWEEAAVHEQRARMRWARATASGLAVRLAREPGTPAELESTVLQVIRDVRLIALSMLAQESYFLRRETDRVPLTYVPFIRDVSAAMRDMAESLARRPAHPHAAFFRTEAERLRNDPEFADHWPGLVREAHATAGLIASMEEAIYGLDHAEIRPARLDGPHEHHLFTRS